MAMLQFMPWCSIGQAYSVGEITIIPFRRGEPINGLDESSLARIQTILFPYKDMEGRPVEKAALVQYKDQQLLADLGMDELEVK